MTQFRNRYLAIKKLNLLLFVGGGECERVLYCLSKLELIYKVQESHTYLTMAPALAPINTIQLANATPAAKSLPPLFPPPRLTALPKINPAPNVNILPGTKAIVAIKYTSTYTSEPIYILDDTQYKKLVMDVDIYLVVSESTGKFVLVW